MNSSSAPKSLNRNKALGLVLRGHMLGLQSKKTRKLRNSVAKTLAKHSACSANWPAPKGPIWTPTNSRNDDATSCTFKTMFRVCNGAEVCRVMSCVNSVMRLIAVKQEVKCSGNVNNVMSDMATTKNLEAVTKANVCSRCTNSALFGGLAGIGCSKDCERGDLSLVFNNEGRRMVGEFVGDATDSESLSLCDKSVPKAWRLLSNWLKPLTLRSGRGLEVSLRLGFRRRKSA
uniref:Uncharacterized protein n=1 Tax=Glossina austeni TaxID=7395 RepID=A0A1A9VTG5_GLOAU